MYKGPLIGFDRCCTKLIHTPLLSILGLIMGVFVFNITVDMIFRGTSDPRSSSHRGSCQSLVGVSRPAPFGSRHRP